MQDHSLNEVNNNRNRNDGVSYPSSTSSGAVGGFHGVPIGEDDDANHTDDAGSEEYDDSDTSSDSATAYDDDRYVSSSGQVVGGIGIGKGEYRGPLLAESVLREAERRHYSQYSDSHFTMSHQLT